MEKTLHKRNYSLDIIRIVAVLAVVMIHNTAGFVENKPVKSTEFILGNILNSFSRLGVPLFLMISGSLFLDESKEVSFKSVLFRYVKTLGVITIIWAIIYSTTYNVIIPLSHNRTVIVRNYISGIITGHYHMWYLYMTIGLYMITPFLKKIVCKENKAMVLVFIAISFCSQFFTHIINAICDLGLNIAVINRWMDKFYLDFFGGYITYFMAGWYIVHIGIKQKLARYIIYCLGVISVLSITFYVHFTGDYTNAYQSIGAPVFIYSVSVFLAFNNIKWKFSERTANKIALLSKLTFGVYIIHILAITIFNSYFPYSRHCVLYTVLRFVVVVFSSFFFSYILSKIPILKKLIKA